MAGRHRLDRAPDLDVPLIPTDRNAPRGPQNRRPRIFDRFRASRGAGHLSLTCMYSNRNRCPACNRTLCLLTSIRIEYRTIDGETLVDEIDTDALRCLTRACRFPLLDLAGLVETARGLRTSGEIDRISRA